MNQTKSENGKKIIKLGVLLLAAVVAALLLVWKDMRYNYEFQGNVEELFAPCYSYSLNSDYDENTGLFTVAGVDPQFYLYGVNRELGGLQILLGKPAEADIPVEVFYQAASDDQFSAKHSYMTTIPMGETTCYIPLKLTTYQALRFDMDGNFYLSAINGYTDSFIATPIIDKEVIQAFLLWLPVCAICFLLFFLAHKERVQRTGTVVKSLFFAEGSRERNHGYDVLRILAAGMVICMHAFRDSMNELAQDASGYHFVYICFVACLSCNMLYILLSGALLLQDKEESVLHFYATRFSKVVIPLICYYVLFMDFNNIFDGKKPWEAVGIATVNVLSGAPSYAPQFWLVYTLVAMYLFTPFLRKMLKILNTRMLQTLVILIMLLNIVASYFPLFGMSFGVTSSLSSWLGAYIIGYYMSTEEAKRHDWLYIRLGIFALFLSILMAYELPESIPYISNCVPTTLFISCGMFSLVRRLDRFFQGPCRIIEIFSKYSYSIILVHWYILFVVVEGKMNLSVLRAGVYGGAVATVAATFLVSFVYGFFFENTVIISLQYVWNRLATGIRNKYKV